MGDVTSGVDRVRIFDTTLRDGEQAPGFSLDTAAKLAMAAQLCELGVDVIEAGFAAASPGDFAAVRAVAEAIEGPVICSLARAQEADILAAAKALAPAQRARIHVFLGTSPTHRQAKLNLSKAEVLAAIARNVALACSLAADVEFSAEDALRTEREFLAEALEAAIAAGAKTINVPDTVGYTTPGEIHALFTYLRGAVCGIEGVVLSAHCHDDLGLALANSLAAIEAGARQVECTINGIGERAGNCALEELAMALVVRRDQFGLDTGVDPRQLGPASRLLTQLTGQPVPRNKAIVGANAFAHEAGIHQHGVMADKRTYEIMDAEAVGMGETRLVLGKHSGRHALRERARALGFELADTQLAAACAEVKALADARREVDEAQLLAILAHFAEPREARLHA